MSNTEPNNTSKGVSEIVPNLVSTIIPVYNRPAMVLRAIDSVLSQTHRPIEIVVVDDGSTDNTPNVIKEKACKHDEIVLLHQDNAGPGVAREVGRQVAKGEYIQYLDSDDVLFPAKFSLQIAALESSGADIAYGKTELSEQGCNGNDMISDTSSVIAIKGTGESRNRLFPYLLHERWWSTSTPLFTRQIVDKAGAWLPLINEEDWAYDSNFAGLDARLVYVDKFVTRIYRHDQHLSDDGSINPVKLQHRSIAKRVIYNNARKVENLFSTEDWQLFSKSVFLLARQCAKANLVKETQYLMQLSIESNGEPRLKHQLFQFLLRFLGGKRAVWLIETILRRA